MNNKNKEFIWNNMPDSLSLSNFEAAKLIFYCELSVDKFKCEKF
ncbi:Uncharacterized protein dnl_60980 [Desulfonema limicola]|uniref:Uncharacterized protein n=1 Tax=Desulfonema limicola TaxID=45656 RepID=A0A975GJM3_9BACT|nr:Uncharacterized protein dnl_60980 [Desulfonema limicola]